MSRTTTILIALFVVLAGITYFLLPSSYDREASDNKSVPSIRIDSASVVKIEIKQPTKNITIENVGGKWMITSPVNTPADPLAVFALLSGTTKLKIGSLISSNPEKQHIFQVDSSGTILTLKERGGTSTTIIAGKMGPSFSEIYFRLPGSKDVYLASGLDNWTINKGVKEWRDKSIIRTSVEAIKEVSITENGKNFVFNRDSSGWNASGKTIDAATINPLLTTLSNLQADDFVDSTIELSGRPIAVNVKTFENIDLSIYPAATEPPKYFIRSSKSPQIFILSKWAVDQLMKPTGKTTGVAPTPVAQIPKNESPVKPKQVVEQPATPAAKTSGTKSTSVTEGLKKTSEQPMKTQQPVLGERKTPVKKETATPPVSQETKKEKSDPASPEISKSKEPAVKPAPKNDAKPEVGGDEDGELTIHVVKAGETMTTIAKKYSVTAEQILKWNLLKSISVKPGQELYIYVKK
jgi:LysM repeat protein